MLAYVHFLYIMFRLLDIIAGRKGKSGISGDVLIDGLKQPDNFKCISGYVVQVRFVVIVLYSSKCQVYIRTLFLRTFLNWITFLLQDDVIMGTLSVKENLYFSAALRLPNSMPWSEKKERVEKVIKQLGLTKCADTKVYVYT